MPGVVNVGHDRPPPHPVGAVAFPGPADGRTGIPLRWGQHPPDREALMPRLMFNAGEAHALLTQADHVAGEQPDLAALYATLATEGVDLDACTPDEDVREQLGMPPLQPAAGGAGAGAGAGDQGGRGHDGGGHPSAA